jgi:Protein of unknown function (DUF2971)
MSDDFMPPAFAEHCRKSVPDVLFHYTGQSGLLGIFETGELWCTKVQYMNDATEFGLALRIAKEKLDQMIAAADDAPSSSPRKVSCAQFRRSLDGLESVNIFAACFCEGRDLLSQWRGYSGESQGYATGFDVPVLEDVAAKYRFRLGSCIYDRHLQSVIVQEAIEHCLEDELAVPQRSQWSFRGPMARLLFQYGVFFKEPSFAEEAEWRLVSAPVMYHQDELGFRAGRSMITPFFKLPVALDGTLPISRVTVGPCPHMELATSAVTMLLMRNGIKAPALGQQVAIPSQIPYRNW